MSWTDNFKKPEGLMGKLILIDMNIGHTPLSKWALSHYNWQKDTNALDIGCGGGMNLKRMLRLSPRGNISGIDISQESLNKSRKVNAKELGKRCSVKYGSADAIPYDKNSFDIVTAFETIYFWKDLKKSFCEVWRVLKPNGTFLIAGELFDPDSVWGKIVKGMSIYTPQEVEAFLLETGFDDVQIESKGKFRLCIYARKEAKK